MTKIRNIIFDWSGVISDDMMQTYETAMAIFEHYGKPRITVEQFRDDFDIPPDPLYRKHGIDDPMPMLDTLYNQFWPRYSTAVPPLFPDARGVLPELKRRGFWLGIVSSHPSHFLEREVAENGFTDVFSDIRGTCRNKVDCITATLEAHHLNSRDTLYVGDMNVDVRSGKKAGVVSAAIGTGYQSRRVLEAENPDFYFESLSDLLTRVQRS